jgi:hypothetical protein
MERMLLEERGAAAEKLRSLNMLVISLGSVLAVGVAVSLSLSMPAARSQTSSR